VCARDADLAANRCDLERHVFNREKRARPKPGLSKDARATRFASPLCPSRPWPSRPSRSQTEDPALRAGPGSQRSGACRRRCPASCAGRACPATKIRIPFLRSALRSRRPIAMPCSGRSSKRLGPDGRDAVWPSTPMWQRRAGQGCGDRSGSAPQQARLQVAAS